MGMTAAGTDLVFGPLSGPAKSHGFIFAFAGTGLCTIIFFSALMAILYYFGIMQAIIWLLAQIHVRSPWASAGAESMQMAAQNLSSDKPKPASPSNNTSRRMTRSEKSNSSRPAASPPWPAGMIAIYTGLMDGTALGGIHVYGPHILAAEVLSAPAAFVMAKLMRPETEEPETGAHFPLTIDRGAHNILEAAANGTRDGLYLFLNVVAMLISFGALVALINWPLGAIGNALHMTEPLDLGRIFGWLLSPIAWIIGITDWADCQRVGGILGIKVATNEFFGFLRLSTMTPEASLPPPPPPRQPPPFSATPPATSRPRAAILATYAICDFANFVSVGIQIGGFTPMAPERKTDFASLAFRAMIAGCLASWMTAAIAGMFV